MCNARFKDAAGWDSLYLPPFSYDKRTAPPASASGDMRMDADPSRPTSTSQPSTCPMYEGPIYDCTVLTRDHCINFYLQGINCWMRATSRPRKPSKSGRHATTDEVDDDKYDEEYTDEFDVVDKVPGYPATLDLRPPQPLFDRLIPIIAM